MADGAKIFDLSRARLARQCDEAVGRAYAAVLGQRSASARVEGDRVVVHCVARLTPDAAETLARALYCFAAEAREAERNG
ncbi:MAG: hypothetical protein EPN91_09405 [Salinibacterium sp.]|nr:MAG: hypothetical protein EPN91_09405 [Salinibacterium sp.]